MSRDPSKSVRNTRGSEGHSGEFSESLESCDGLPQYSYQPLEEGYMRVLILEPGKRGDPLFGQLVPVPMPSEPEMFRRLNLPPPSGQYEAISYAWGPKEFPNRITLGGGGILGITLSLHQALQRFRYDDSQRTLWADAICINQEDKREKSSQVAQMARIYKHAQQTLVWLGESDGSAWLAFGVFAAIDEWWRRDPSKKRLSVEELGFALFRLRQSCVCCADVTVEDIPAAMSLAAQAVNRFFDRSWFKRLWVVQEYAFSQNVVLCCGSHRCKAYRCVLPLQTWHNRPPKTSPFSSATFETVAAIARTNVRKGGAAKDSLIKLLRSTAARVCSDPRDRVFAIKDMCNAETWHEAAPDYGIELPVLFTRIVSKCLTKNMDLEQSHAAVLMAMAPGTRARPGELLCLPSWIPDLQRLDHHLSVFTWQRYEKRNRLSSVPFTRLSLGRNPLELRGVGVICGKAMYTLKGSQIELIGRIGSDPDQIFRDVNVFPETRKLDRWLQRCGDFMSIFQSINSRSVDSITSLPIPLFRRVQESVQRILYWMELAGHGPLSKEQLEIVKKLFAQGVATSIGPGRLFSVVQTDTATQYGWVPADTKESDELWFFRGCPWPFVLRRLPDSDACQLIGDACFPHLLGIQEDIQYWLHFPHDIGMHNFNKYGEQSVVYIR